MNEIKLGITKLEIILVIVAFLMAGMFAAVMFF